MHISEPNEANTHTPFVKNMVFCYVYRAGPFGPLSCPSASVMSVLDDSNVIFDFTWAAGAPTGGGVAGLHTGVATWLPIQDTVPKQRHKRTRNKLIQRSFPVSKFALSIFTKKKCCSKTSFSFY